MRKLLKINLDDLLKNGIINSETAERIESFYNSKTAPSESRILAIFGVLGAALIGLGIILIVAHNWDDLSKFTKTMLAFLPMLIGQGLVGFTLFKKSENKAWREASATFLFFAVGACIAMVSQIYHIEGELHSFLLTWIIICLPLVYVMRSAMVSLLIIGFATWYAFAYKWDVRGRPIPWAYLGILIAVFPFFYRLWKEEPRSNSFAFHLWFWAGSLALGLSTFGKDETILLWLVYAALFGIYFLLGSLETFKERRLIANPLLIIGALGSIILFLITSFGEVMRDFESEILNKEEALTSPEIYLTILLFAFVAYLIAKTKFATEFGKIHPLKFAAIIFLISFFIGKMTGSPILSNLFLLWAGMFYILRGEAMAHLGWLNFGLLILATLIMCRFFDVDLSFVTRGILFILMGCGFLFANIRIIRKRKMSDITSETN